MAVAQGHLQDTGARAHPLAIMDASVDKRKRRKRESQLDVLSLPSPLPGPQKEEKAEWAPSSKVGPAMLLLPSLPSLDQWNTVINATKPVITFTGTAAARNAGPLIGLVDIGISEDAYLFRTALPGVRKEEGMNVAPEISVIANIHFWRFLLFSCLGSSSFYQTFVSCLDSRV